MARPWGCKMPNQYTEPYDGPRTTGDQLREWRQAHGWGRAHVAVMLDCAYETVARAEQRGSELIPVTLQESLKQYPPGVEATFKWSVLKPLKSGV